MNKGTSKGEKKQDSQELENKCWKFLQLFLEQLHGLVDRRIVKTLLDLVMIILVHRNRNTGLWLSELGDHLLGGGRREAKKQAKNGKKKAKPSKKCRSYGVER